MTKFIAILLGLYSAAAFCCSPVVESPQQMFDESVAVVLAQPIARSYKPKNARDPKYVGNVRETILWETLVEWKGKHKPGTKFTTRQSFEITGRDSCGPWRPNYRADEAHLLFLQGKEPYSFYLHYPTKYSTDLFVFLEHQRSGR